MRITLNDAEQRITKYVSARREEYNKKTAMRNYKVDSSRTDLQVTEDGIGAEIAFCRLCNCYPDLQYTERRAWDAVHVFYGKVDVKTTKHKHGRLIAHLKTSDQKEFADSFALVVGTFPDYEFVGWTDGDILLREERITRLKETSDDECYAMDQKELWKPCHHD